MKETMESRGRSRTSRKKIREAALGAVQFAGLLAITVAVPNAVGGLEKLGLLPGSRSRETMHRAYQRLLKSGHLQYEGKFLRLTAKGERELRVLKMLSSSRQKVRRWDRKWRVLIFDIPERRKSLREKVRITVQSIGFIRLQDSVWIYPYDCEDLITLLKADMRIGRELLYMIVEELEGDGWICREFGLK